MGGSAPKSTEQTTEQRLPPWLDAYAQDTLDLSRGIADRPLQQYDGPRIAGFTPDQLAAQQGVRGMQGQTGNFLQGLAGGAAGLAGYQPQQVAAGTLPGTDLSGYMNPYLGSVETGALNALDQQRQAAQNGLADQAISARAFGGSRQALQAGVLDATAAQKAGELSSQIRSGAFTNAQQMAQQDLARGLQAGMANQSAGLQGAGLNLQALGMAGQLGQNAQQANYGDLAMLSGIGQEQQQLGQANLDQNYQQFLDAWNYPMQQLQTRLAALGGTPYGGTTVTTMPQAGGTSPAMGALGGAASGASAGSMFGPWGTAIGAVAGGLYGGLSSR
ncbi:MAG TPA: hypothetical protein VGM87_15355 [Roseomonas sp.]|jgi:hypothetical protein